MIDKKFPTKRHDLNKNSKDSSMTRFKAKGDFDEHSKHDSAHGFSAPGNVKPGTIEDAYVELDLDFKSDFVYKYVSV